MIRKTIDLGINYRYRLSKKFHKAVARGLLLRVDHIWKDREGPSGYVYCRALEDATQEESLENR